MDVYTPAERSRLMARIHGEDTTPELVVRRYLHAAGLRYRLHDRRLPGRPDVFLPRYRVAVEVRGCFWHRHEGCRLASEPKSHRAFWTEKFERNVRRDALNEVKIRAMGVRLLVVWECELAKEKRERTLAELLRRIVRPTAADLDLTPRKGSGLVAAEAPTEYEV